MRHSEKRSLPVGAHFALNHWPSCRVANVLMEMAYLIGPCTSFPTLTSLGEKIRLDYHTYWSRWSR